MIIRSGLLLWLLLQTPAQQTPSFTFDPAVDQGRYYCDDCLVHFNAEPSRVIAEVLFVGPDGDLDQRCIVVYAREEGRAWLIDRENPRVLVWAGGEWPNWCDERGR